MVSTPKPLLQNLFFSFKETTFKPVHSPAAVALDLETASAVGDSNDEHSSSNDGGVVPCSDGGDKPKSSDGDVSPHGTSDSGDPPRVSSTRLTTTPTTTTLKQRPAATPGSEQQFRS
ncbi:hypothetical protein RIF29_00702 [Crotalaria pallida]|uniref:Uncharacterized protein n=1 Tax=Crotalaria pallida TaxID=3830 RepID=A0AAN9IWT3_CROPI